MKITLKIIASTSLLFILSSCTKKADLTDPQSVVSHFRSNRYHYTEKSLISAYDLLALEAKKQVTQAEFIENWMPSNNSDTIKEWRTEHRKSSNGEVKLLPVNPEYPLYRRIEIEQVAEGKVKYIHRYTLLNEDNEWGIIYPYIMGKAVWDLHYQQKYDEAIRGAQKLLEFDPFYDNALNCISWSYHRKGQNDSAEVYCKKAIQNNPKMSDHYSLLAGIYESNFEYDLAIFNYQKAIEYSLNRNVQQGFYSNLSISYRKAHRLEESIIATDSALAIDSTRAHTWWMRAKTFEEMKDTANYEKCMNKALTFQEMMPFLQASFFTDYLILLMSQSDLAEEDTQKLTLLQKAKEYAVKAADLSPDNYTYKRNIEIINNKIESISL